MGKLTEPLAKMDQILRERYQEDLRNYDSAKHYDVELENVLVIINPARGMSKSQIKKQDQIKLNRIQNAYLLEEDYYILTALKHGKDFSEIARYLGRTQDSVSTHYNRMLKGHEDDVLKLKERSHD